MPILLIFVGCKIKNETKSIDMISNLSSINDEMINALSHKKIFFGHMSVGFNIIDGAINIIKNNNRFKKINIYEWTKDADLIKYGIYHSKNGKNSFPKSKCDAFKNKLFENNFGQKFDITLLKFCYIDFNSDTDVYDIFNYYIDTIEYIKQRFPNLKIIHVTIPLFVHINGFKDYLKKLFEGDISNVKRNQFNELLIKKYENIDPIFDLATIESTYPDNSRETFKYKNKQFFSLIKRYTYDGGHLNDRGKYIAAKEFLHLLAEVSARQT